MTGSLHIRSFVLLALGLAVACDSDDKAKEESAKGPIEAPFAVSVHKVEVLDEVAPNQTYLDNGLGTKAGEGKTFVCVQYEVTNEGGAEARKVGAEDRLQVKVSALPPARVVDSDGAETELSVKAAGSYQPADWKSDTGDVGAGETKKKTNCFPRPKGKTDGLKLVFADEVDGRSWRVETALPATAP